MSETVCCLTKIEFQDFSRGIPLKLSNPKNSISGSIYESKILIPYKDFNFANEGVCLELIQAQIRRPIAHFTG